MMENGKNNGTVEISLVTPNPGLGTETVKEYWALQTQ